MTIRPDDPSAISAYLDGELDPASAAAIAATPGFARRARELAAIRDLVGGLARPTAPAGVSGPVLARIEANPPLWLRRRRLWRKAGGGRTLGLGLGGTLAVGAWLLWPATPAIAPPRPRAVAPAVVGPPPVVVVEPPKPAVDVPAPASPVHVPAPSTPTAYALPPPVDAGQRESARQLGRLLARPSPELLSIAVGPADAEATGRVAEAVRAAGLRSPEYGRVRLDPGGLALVLTVEGREAERLRAALRAEFADVAGPVSLPAELSARLLSAPGPEYLLPERSPSVAGPAPKGAAKGASTPGTLVLWVHPAD